MDDEQGSPTPTETTGRRQPPTPSTEQKSKAGRISNVIQGYDGNPGYSGPTGDTIGRATALVRDQDAPRVDAPADDAPPQPAAPSSDAAPNVLVPETPDNDAQVHGDMSSGQLTTQPLSDRVDLTQFEADLPDDAEDARQRMHATYRDVHIDSIVHPEGDTQAERLRQSKIMLHQQITHIDSQNEHPWWNAAACEMHKRGFLTEVYYETSVGQHLGASAAAALQKECKEAMLMLQIPDWDDLDECSRQMVAAAGWTSSEWQTGQLPTAWELRDEGRLPLSDEIQQIARCIGVGSITAIREYRTFNKSSAAHFRSQMARPNKLKLATRTSGGGRHATFGYIMILQYHAVESRRTRGEIRKRGEVDVQRSLPFGTPAAAQRSPAKSPSERTNKRRETSADRS
jgi:hypothetical protein